ncbi:carboxypeptidase-like regulatory domain-containing protein [Mucilaginibacter lappiensis]|uniref:CarboxypepD_reg-like domain-containing protein n=1 Tax=Mucilaginibacter lappiensis TaxID=354630 RepID=A0A841JC73_9SPHI|nr:carboxypeptidase-like regulatory domain-containing protein [Mucilaginibacter lappiensis]MBB6127186.1 hypothetical protein [Mucilaginibacter lappiensis]
MKYIYGFLLLLFPYCCIAQSITGRVFDQKSKPIEFATIILKKDSAIINTYISDINGAFQIKNLSYNELLDIIRSKHFFTSTDGSAHGLPNKEPLARIIHSNPGVTLHFNYQDIAEKIFPEKDHQEYTFTIKYSTGTDYLFKG